MVLPHPVESRRWLPIVSLLCLAGLWQLVALLLNSRNLPSPIDVSHVFWQACVSGELPYHLGVILPVALFKVD